MGYQFFRGKEILYIYATHKHTGFFNLMMLIYSWWYKKEKKKTRK